MDHQRNGIVTYSRTVSPRFSSQSSLSFTRTTPRSFRPQTALTESAVKFNDNLYEGFNTAGGSVMSAQQTQSLPGAAKLHCIVWRE